MSNSIESLTEDISQKRGDSKVDELRPKTWTR